MKAHISLIIVLALALLSWWFQDFLQDTPIITVKKDEHFPDYFMENFTVTSMNDQGQPAYILQAKKMEHFADDDSTDIYQPLIQFKDANGDWSISAQKAQILKDKNIIHLYQKVKVHRLQSKTRTPLSIETRYLSINTETKIAETDELAHLKTQNLELDTRGMVFDNKQGILKLKSSIKGTYEPAR
jgi:lipopolysaccharide export system protein LptC